MSTDDNCDYDEYDLHVGHARWAAAGEDPRRFQAAVRRLRGDHARCPGQKPMHY